MDEKDNKENETSESFEAELGLKSESKLAEPRMYRVLMHNDHYTTMEFVVEVLMKIFHKPGAEATKIMLDIHKKGMGICGVYTYDIAVTKISEVHKLAKKSQYPLKCSYEEA
ncbi:MAG: ATP-dependent Clp protease adaptor ClpS [Spirochaetes bacterium]|nr:ATP-dependent Clp protease adaptor ClpS [Spirochaetota bacterium]